MEIQGIPLIVIPYRYGVLTTKAMNKRKMIKKSKIQPTKEEQYKQKIAELEAKVADQEMEIDILKKLRALRQQRGENKH